MRQNDFLIELDKIIDDAQAGLMASVDGAGAPHMRWMTPGLLQDRPGAIYAVTSKSFAKREQLSANSKVQWMFQSRSLNKIIYVNGAVNLVDNSALLTEVLEILGPRLQTFWKVNPDQCDLIVLETVMESGQVFLPLQGLKEKLQF